MRDTDDRRESEAPLAERTSLAAIAARVRQARTPRAVRAHATGLAKAQIRRAPADGEGLAGAGRRQRRARKRAQAKVGIRDFRLLERADEAWVLGLRARKVPVECVVSAAGTTPCDEVLWYALEHLNLRPALAALTPAASYPNKAGKTVARRSMYSPEILNILGLLARSAGHGGGPTTQAALLCDERWMQLLGFNAQEVHGGATERSASLRGKTRDDQKHFLDADEAGPVREDGRAGAPRGALSSQTLAGHESALDTNELMGFYDSVVRALVRTMQLRGKRQVLVDTTLCEVAPSFKGAASVRRKVKVKSKAHRPREASALVYGFKVWTAMDAATGLVLAMIVDTAEKPENLHVHALLQRAQANLGTAARIDGVALDRGFMDGDLLHRLASELQINWLVPAKANMHVTTEARDRVSQALRAAGQPAETALETAIRLAKSGKSSSRIRFSWRPGVADQQPVVVAQVDGLECTDWYGPGGADSSRLNRKDFRPTPLHATVVLSWPDRPSTDAEDAAEHDAEAADGHAKGPLVLLSAVGETGLGRFDRYDQRSLIENRVYRDAKQHFALGQSLARNAKAFVSATIFSMAALMLHRGLSAHTEANERRAEQADRRAPALGVLRYRRLLELRNRNQVIVVAEGRYAVVAVALLARLAGLQLA